MRGYVRRMRLPGAVLAIALLAATACADVAAAAAAEHPETRRQPPPPRPRIHIYSLPDEMSTNPHGFSRLIADQIRQSPYHEPDPDKADFYFILQRLFLHEETGAVGAMFDHIRTAWPYWNRSVASGQTRHYMARRPGLFCAHGLSCAVRRGTGAFAVRLSEALTAAAPQVLGGDHGPGDQYAPRPLEMGAYPDDWNPASPTRVVGHIQARCPPAWYKRQRLSC